MIQIHGARPAHLILHVRKFTSVSLQNSNYYIVPLSFSSRFISNALKLFSLRGGGNWESMVMDLWIGARSPGLGSTEELGELACAGGATWWCVEVDKWRREKPDLSLSLLVFSCICNFSLSLSSRFLSNPSFETIVLFLLLIMIKIGLVSSSMFMLGVALFLWFIFHLIIGDRALHWKFVECHAKSFGTTGWFWKRKKIQSVKI